MEFMIASQFITAKLQHLRDCFDNTDLKAISFQVFLDGIGVIEGGQQLVAEFGASLQAQIVV